MNSVIAHWHHDPNLNYVGIERLYMQYSLTASAYGVNLMFVEVSKTLNWFGEIGKKNLKDALELFPSSVPIYLHGDGKIYLSDFIHPPNAVYIIGSDYEEMVIPDDSISLQIETAKSPGKELFSYIAMGILLHDIFVKGNING